MPLITDAKDERLSHHDIRISEHQVLRDSLRAALAARDTLAGRVKALEEAMEWSPLDIELWIKENVRHKGDTAALVMMVINGVRRRAGGKG